MCIVYRGSVAGEHPKEIARTEQISDNLNPDWSKRIRIDYFFEAKQPLIFKM
jgi:hypothetical protein